MLWDQMLETLLRKQKLEIKMTDLHGEANNAYIHGHGMFS